VKSVSEYWGSLTATRRALLVVGLIAGSPIVITLIVVAGLAEAFRFITQISF